MGAAPPGTPASGTGCSAPGPGALPTAAFCWVRLKHAHPSWAPSDLGLARPVCPPTSLHCALSGQMGFFGKSERGQSLQDRTPVPSSPASPSEAWLALSQFPARCGLGFFVLGAGRRTWGPQKMGWGSGSSRRSMWPWRQGLWGAPGSHLRASWWEQTQSALGVPQGQTGASQ